MAFVNIGVGRKRVTRQAQPHEAGYVSAIASQMAGVREALKQIIENIESNTVPAVKYALKPMFETSQQLVPMDTGRLKRSGFLEVRRTTRGISASIGYAKGGRPHYATLVHERTEFFHKPPTQAKFLEEAVNRHIGEVSGRITAYLKRRTRLN